MNSSKSTPYFRKYLEVAPLSLALWRTGEAQAVSQIPFEKPLLDIGCGFGEFMGVFMNQQIEVGIDINQKDLILAAKSKKYQNLILADASHLPFPDRSFKTVISISTLEHIATKDLKKVFSETYRILELNGKFIFTVPTQTINNQLLFPRLMRKIKLNFIATGYSKIFHRVFKHRSIISEQAWRKLTEKAGFTITKSCGTCTEKQLSYFEIGLLTAFPSQINRTLFKKRLIFSPKIRVKLLTKLFKKLFEEESHNSINIMIVAQKTR